jgi:hypothetical protein
MLLHASGMAPLFSGTSIEGGRGGGRCLDTVSTYTCRTGTGTAKRELANLLKTGPDKRNEKVVSLVR